MADPTMTPDAGALDGGASSTPAARTSSPAPQPTARVSPESQYEQDMRGVGWKASQRTPEQARWNAQQRERITGEPAAPPQADQTTKPAAETMHKFGGTSVSETELQEFLQQKGARESGRLQAPDSPDGYKIGTSKEFKPPQGVEFSINENDPSFGLLKTWAHRNGVPQSELSALVDIYAGKQVGDLALGKAAHDAEVAKLGGSGPGRVDALNTWLRGILGDQGRVLAGVRESDGNVRSGVLWTADIISAFEALQHRMQSQGAASYSGHGRDTGADAGKIPGYENMSFAQRRHAQEQLRGR
jgi:hypothetical protein